MKTAKQSLSLVRAGLITLSLMCGIAGTSVLAVQASQQARILTFESSTAPSGKLVVSGTSSLHDWDVVTETIVGQMTIILDQAMDLNGALKSNPKVTAKVTVPVKSLESGKGGMDKKMYKALKADQHKESGFILDSLERVLEPSALDEGITHEAKGKLTVAGQTRLVRVPVTIHWDAQKQAIRVIGQVDLLMTDYGIDPPRALLGTLKTGNAITVSFDWMPELIL